VRSKADGVSLIYCTEPTTKKWKRICAEVSVNSPENPESSEEEKEGNGGKDLQKRKVLCLEWNSDGVTDDAWEWWVDGTDGRSATRIGDLELETLVSISA